QHPAAAARTGSRTRAQRTTDAGRDLRGPCAQSPIGLVQCVVLGKLGSGRALSSTAGDAVEWARHHRAVLAADFAAEPARRIRRRTHGAPATETGAGAARALPARAYRRDR